MRVTERGDADRKNWAAADVIRRMGPVTFDCDLATAFTLIVELRFAAGHPVAGRSGAARRAASFVDGLVRSVPLQFRRLIEALSARDPTWPAPPACFLPTRYESAEDLVEMSSFAIRGEISPGTAMAVLAQLGIALAHPVNSGPAAAVTRKFAATLRAQFPAEIPALDAIMGDVLLGSGWPTNDEGKSDGV